MSELIHEFSRTVSDASGAHYTVRVRGDQDENGHWQGWLEFVPVDGDAFRRTPRETTQGQRGHLVYWASGLSASYLEQALRRAEPPPDESEVPPPLATDPDRPARLRDPGAGAPATRIVIETLDPSVPRRLMAMDQLPEGVVRRVAGGGLILYEGMEAPEGGPSRYRFLVQCGPGAAGNVVLANRLWSVLRDEDVVLRVSGRRIPVRTVEIIDALNC